jgi:hypothetical protein
MPFTGYQFTPRGDTAQQHVNYLGTDGNVHELFWNGDWHHNNLTENANAIANPKAPPGNTSPKGYEFGGNQHVIYQGVDLHVHELI